MVPILEDSILLILESAIGYNHKVVPFFSLPAAYVCRSEFNNAVLLSLIFQVDISQAVSPSKFCVSALSPLSRIVQIVNKC
jgi:hypothetical protein